MAAVTQTDVLLVMSYLLGEQSVPTSSIDDRKKFIQMGLERTLDQSNFRDVYAISTVSLSQSGNFYAGSLPSDAGFQPSMDVRVINSGSGDDQVLERIEYEDQDDFVQGDNKYWISGSEGSYTLTTRETYPNVVVRYYQKAPTINASVSTTFPRASVLARAAIVYYRQSENPEADVSVDEALYQKELQELIAKESIDRPRTRRRTVAEEMNTYTGNVEAGYYRPPAGY